MTPLESCVGKRTRAIQLAYIKTKIVVKCVKAVDFVQGQLLIESGTNYKRRVAETDSQLKLPVDNGRRNRWLWP
jgi:hypothetical protein